jgi:WD40 repeat protein
MVVVWDAETLGERFTLDSGTSYPGFTSWSPTGDRILTVNFDGTTRVWDASSGVLLLDFTGHENMVFSGEWSPDGNRIVTAEPGGDTLILWEAATGEEIWRLSLGAWVASWSPDGTRIAVSTGRDGEGSIRDAATGEVLLNFFPEDYTGLVEGVAWSGDGKRIVVFSDGDGWIFDTTTGEQLVELSSGVTGTVWSVSWSPGSERIFAIGGDGTYRVFEAQTGRELLVYELGGWPDGALSPDGTQMLIATNDGKTSLYPVWLTTEDLIDYAKECCLVHELTPEEREVFGLPER